MAAGGATEKGCSRPYLTETGAQPAAASQIPCASIPPFCWCHFTWFVRSKRHVACAQQMNGNDCIKRTATWKGGWKRGQMYLQVNNDDDESTGVQVSRLIIILTILPWPGCEGPYLRCVRWFVILFTRRKIICLWAENKKRFQFQFRLSQGCGPCASDLSVAMATDWAGGKGVEMFFTWETTRSSFNVS